MKSEKKLLIILAFNITLMLLEISGGIISRSLALLSDAGHMLTDSLAVFLSYLAMQWSKKPPTEKKTFGYHRTEILVALVNGLALLFISGYIFYEAVDRFFHPVEIRTGLLLVIASIGLAGNLFGVFLLRKDSHSSLNVHSAFLHVMGDMLSSVGVIIGGVIIAFTGWNVVDSLIGIMIAGIILRGAVNLILESSEVLLEAVPKDIDMNALRADVEMIPGVKEFHEIHIWTITSGRRALSGHILSDNIPTSESQRIICQARVLLAQKYNITHTTLEFECERCIGNVCAFTKTAPHTEEDHRDH